MERQRQGSKRTTTVTSTRSRSSEVAHAVAVAAALGGSCSFAVASAQNRAKCSNSSEFALPSYASCDKCNNNCRSREQATGFCKSKHVRTACRAAYDLRSIILKRLLTSSVFCFIMLLFGVSMLLEAAIIAFVGNN